ncbi:MAG: hypothetical protein QFF03_24905 [Pseudomonadota bacterium]|nr:hypothetical protein [Pseudomonadota bacterium]
MTTRRWAGRCCALPGAALLLLSLGMAGPAQAAAPRTLAMQELLAHPGNFAGQRVRVVGFLQLAFESNALYLTRADGDNAVTGHALLLELSNGQLRAASKLNHGHVVVDGVVRVADIGHGGKWIAALRPVTRVAMWRK